MKSARFYANANKDLMLTLIDYLHCLEHGMKAVIEVRDNMDPEIAKESIKKKNPELDNPFNWTSSCGVPYLNTDKTNYFNDTEKDLTENWIIEFGLPAAIKAYEENGVICKELMMHRQNCIPHPVRVKDANTWRELYIGDGYKYSFFRYLWQAKEGIPYYIPDDSIGNVFVIRILDENDKRPDTLPNMETQIREAAELLVVYADSMHRE